MNKTFRITTTILIILLLVRYDFLPENKAFVSVILQGGPAGGAQMMGGPGSGQQQVLNVSGYLIAPAQMNEMIKSSGPYYG